ncbi:MAG: hypothetical protein R6T92_05310 [Desulfosalsimonadaceae bacterium]
MAKKIKYTAIALVLLLAAGFLVLTLTVDSIVGGNIEKIGSEMTGTPVTVEDVSISLFSGEGTITGFRIANPEGYSAEHAMVMNDFFIRIDLFSLLSNEKRVEEIIVTGPALYVEQKLPGNNLLTILNRINKRASASRKEPPGTSPEPVLIIDHFLLKDGSVNLYTSIGKERTAWVEMSMVELYGIGRDKRKNAVEQVVEQIAVRIIEQALKSAARSGAAQMKDAIEDIFR